MTQTISISEFKATPFGCLPILTGLGFVSNDNLLLQNLTDQAGKICRADFEQHFKLLEPIVMVCFPARPAIFHSHP